MDFVASRRSEWQPVSEISKIDRFTVLVQLNGQQRDCVNLFLHPQGYRPSQLTDVHWLGELSTQEINLSRTDIRQTLQDCVLFLFIHLTVRFRGVNHRTHQNLRLLIHATHLRRRRRGWKRLRWWSGSGSRLGRG